MPIKSSNTSFGELLKSARLEAGFFTLQKLSEALVPYGLIVDPSLLSHWQRGARLPKDRQVILLLLTLLVKNEGIRTPIEANKFSEAAGMGFLTEKEMFELFPREEIKIPERSQKKPLKIYFTAAIAQAPLYGKYYHRIINTLKQLGHEVQHEHITKSNLNELRKVSPQDRVLYYQKFLNWVSQSDIVIAEASFPSTINIGHEITLALNKNKPVIVLFNEKSENLHLTRGLASKKFFLMEYTEDNLEELVQQVITFVQT